MAVVLDAAPRAARDVALLVVADAEGGHVVVAHMRPATFLEERAARHEAADAVRALVEWGGVSTRYGISVAAPPEGGARAALADLLALVELGMVLIERLDGITDNGGAPVETPSPSVLTALFQTWPQAARAFEAEALGYVASGLAEGNVFAPFSAGSPAEEGATAAGVADPAQPAPGAA